MHENVIFQTIYHVLKNDGYLKTIIQDVYQFPPPDREYPYLLIELLNVKGTHGLSQGKGQQSFEIQVHIVSDYKGIREVNSIAGGVQKALEKTFPIDGGNMVLKFQDRIVTGQQDTKQQRIRLSTLQFQGLFRF